MPLYEATITIRIHADDAGTASGIAAGAAQHLQETYNDDGSLRGIASSPARPYLSDADVLQASGVWFTFRGCRHMAFDHSGRLLASETSQPLALSRAADVLRART